MEMQEQGWGLGRKPQQELLDVRLDVAQEVVPQSTELFAAMDTVPEEILQEASIAISAAPLEQQHEEQHPLHSELSHDSPFSGTDISTSSRTETGSRYTALLAKQGQRSKGVPVQPRTGYWSEVRTQVVALTKKHFILAKRNWISTSLRLCSSLFFLLIVVGINESVKGVLREGTHKPDVPNPEDTVIEGIPACLPKRGKEDCFTFAYAPAPSDRFKPYMDYPTVSDFATVAPALCAAAAGLCGDADCNAVRRPEECAGCCEAFRVHKVVRHMMATNGTSVTLPVPAEKVVGLANASSLDGFLLDNPQLVQGAFVFDSPDNRTLTFTTQQNWTTGRIRGKQAPHPLFRVALPMQVAAHKAIAAELLGSEEEVDARVMVAELAHAGLTSTAGQEHTEAPQLALLLLEWAVFVWAMQVGEVVLEKELKLREAMAVMGMHELSYWLSWHLYQCAMAVLASLFCFCCGAALQLPIFTKTDFSVLFVDDEGHGSLTLWLFCQAMNGLAFFVAAFLHHAASASKAGFAMANVCCVLWTIVGVFGFPYSDLDDGRREENDTDAQVLLAVLPPTLLVQAMWDLGHLAEGIGLKGGAFEDEGLAFAERYSYCSKFKQECPPAYSVGQSWTWFIALYVAYSLLGLYFEHVLPDEMWVRKQPWYYVVSPTYWGFTEANVEDRAAEEESVDPDVQAEQREVQGRCNAAMAEGSAVEVRGLRQSFMGPGRHLLHAVRGPWLSVQRGSLLALLGPNGAGKTTLIRMLTGSLPPTGGNALVLGHTVAHPAGVQAVRRRQGVCPQFDVAWPGLSARSTLELFAHLKGVPAARLSEEVLERLEEVKLAPEADKSVSALSGGMRRRLSVAVALLGDPQIVYLDEPTTGLDPISRRLVWDAIEATKQRHCTVILTTHNMEEADVLADRIAIMAKGKLSCLGSSAALKMRFGAGYKVSVGCGEVGSEEVKELVQRRVAGASCEPCSGYLHFQLPKTPDAEMAELFGELEARGEQLGVEDVQLSQPTLEDAFLAIAARAETEAASSLVEVELSSGEVAQVPLGSDEEQQSASGVTFRVRWGTDEEGKLVAVDTLETRLREQTITITIPEHLQAGELLRVECGGEQIDVQVPPEMKAGETLTTTLMVKEQAGARPDAAAPEEAQRDAQREGVEEGLARLRAPLLRQAEALVRKNLAVQRRSVCTNCLLLTVPLVFILTVLLLQHLLYTVGKADAGLCPYCGPGDEYSRWYCKGRNCTEVFFPRMYRDYFLATFGEDPAPLCEELARSCGGNGHASCFLSRFSESSACPLAAAATQPPLYHHTRTGNGSRTAVLYTAESDFADAVAQRLFDDAATKQKLQGAAAAVVHLMFNAMFGLAAGASCSGALSSERQQQGLCALLQHGAGTPRACCRDLSSRPWQPDATLQSGQHYWSPTPQLHNDLQYNRTLQQCLEAPAATLPACNLQLRRAWAAAGVRFASGAGRGELLETLLALDEHVLRRVVSAAATDVLGEEEVEAITRQLLAVQRRGEEVHGEALLAAAPQLQVLFAAHEGGADFWCVEPRYSEAAAQALPQSQCINWEEGLARWAAAEGVGAEAHYPVQPGEDVEMIAVEGVLRWLSLARSLVQRVAFPSGVAQSGMRMRQPRAFDCAPEASGAHVCAVPQHVVHPMAMPELAWSTPAEAGSRPSEEPALSSNKNSWWNRYHVLPEEQRGWWHDEVQEEEKAEDDEWQWKADDEWHWNMRYTVEVGCHEDSHICKIHDAIWRDQGRLRLLARDCEAMRAEVCYLQQLLNLTGVEFECSSSSPAKVASRADLNARIYQQHTGRGGAGDQQHGAETEDMAAAFDLHATSAASLELTVMYNSTLGWEDLVAQEVQAPPRALVSGISHAFEAFVNAKLGTEPWGRVTLAAMGVSEMPKGAKEFRPDIGSVFGPLLFTLAFSTLFPIIVVRMVYEKEQRLRMMMRMMGLGTPAFWIINYAFWLSAFGIFVLILAGIGAATDFSSGFTIGLFKHVDWSVHFVFLLLFVNNTLSLAFLWSTLISTTRVANVAPLLFLISMAMSAPWQAPWAQDNVYNSEAISEHAKTLMTLFPFWNFYRGWNEYREFAYQAVFHGVPGLSWEQVASDASCSMDVVLIALFVEWPLFLLLALYLDQVRDSGNGVPQHPLFFFGGRHRPPPAGLDLRCVDEAEADGYKDVAEEEERVRAAERLPAERRDAVVLHDLRKVYRGRRQVTVAVQRVTLGVRHAECFGLLGPNGAGKTSVISMLTGCAQPTSGTALVGGLDMRGAMAEVQAMVGMCAQSDMLWDLLSPREHLRFYARLKNLAGAALEEAVEGGLQAVRLTRVGEAKVATLSGGMRRRLSVAIAMVGGPLASYMDEPTTGLDPASRRALWTAMKKAKRRQALLLTTHSMVEAEALCDRLAVMVDGRLRCLGSPKELTRRLGGFYVLTILSQTGAEARVADMVRGLAAGARLVHRVGSTHKFELPAKEISLSQLFSSMAERDQALGIKDWGVASTTLEDAFVKISRQVPGCCD